MVISQEVNECLEELPWALGPLAVPGLGAVPRWAAPVFSRLLLQETPQVSRSLQGFLRGFLFVCLKNWCMDTTSSKSEEGAAAAGAGLGTGSG